MGMQNGTTTLGDSLAVSYKAKHSLNLQSSNHTPRCDFCPNDLKMWLHKNLHINVYSNCIHNHPKLEATMMSFKRQIHKLSHIHAKQYYSTIKVSGLSSQEKTWMNMKCTLTSKRSHSETITYTIIPIIWHSRKNYRHG